MEFLSIQPELQLAMTIAVVRIALRSPDAAVPISTVPAPYCLGGMTPSNPAYSSG